MKSDFVELAIFEKIFPYLTPDNRRAVSLALETGLRIGDVVALKRRDLNKKTGVLKYKAQKTGKKGELRLSWEIVEQLCRNSGKIYLFEGKNENRHRTRQAVWCDVKKACKKAGVYGVNVTPHSCRKNFAVNDLRKTGDMQKVQADLQHTNIFLTQYYAHSDRQKAEGFSPSALEELLRKVIREELPRILKDFADKKF